MKNIYFFILISFFSFILVYGADLIELNKQKTELLKQKTILHKEALKADYPTREKIAGQITDLNKKLSSLDDQIKRIEFKEKGRIADERANKQRKQTANKILREQPVKTNRLLEQVEKLESQSSEKRQATTRKRFALFQRSSRSADSEAIAESWLMPKEANELRQKAKLIRKISKSQRPGLGGLMGDINAPKSLGGIIWQIVSNLIGVSADTAEAQKFLKLQDKIRNEEILTTEEEKEYERLKEYFGKMDYEVMIKIFSEARNEIMTDEEKIKLQKAREFREAREARKGIDA